MKPETKVIAGALAAAGIVGGLAVAGQYAGGALFAKWQELPASAVGVFTLHDYWVAYGDVPSVKKALAACTVVSAIVPIAPIGVAAALLFRVLADGRRELHGSARFARHGEIIRSGLLDEARGKPQSEPSIIVGKYRGQYLTFPGQEFVLLAAPTRGEKGVSVVIPNLLTYPDSVVVLDIKGENYDITSRYRQTCGQKVYRWAPFDRNGDTHCWNPLTRIERSAPHERVDALQNMGARLFHAPDPRHRFFYDAASDLFQGVALYLIETGRMCTFGEILRRGTDAEKPLREHLGTLVATPGLSGDCVGALARVLTAPDDTMGSITSTFNTCLRIFSNPAVDAATSRCDFDVDQVRRQRMSIYLVLPAKRIAMAGVLANLLFAQLIDENMDAAPGEDPSIICQCLLLMDEASSVGKVDAIATGNAFIAGYGIRLLTVLHSEAQYIEVYGQQMARTIIVNHGIKLIFPPRDTKESKAISDSLGTFTMKATSTSRNRGRSSSTGESTSDQGRALMLAQELEQMPQHHAIVLGKGRPIRCEKAYYYKDPIFIDRLKSVSPTLVRLCEPLRRGRLPTKAMLDEARRSGELRARGIVPIDIAAWHAQHWAAPAGSKAHPMLSARELLNLDRQQASAGLVHAALVAMQEDLAEAMPGYPLDIKRMLEGLRLEAGEPSAQAGQMLGAQTNSIEVEHA